MKLKDSILMKIESGYGADLAGLTRGDIIKSIDGFKNKPIF